MPSEVKVFGKGGMKAESVPSDMLSQVFDFRPDLVVLNLGGNDIRPASSPKTIFNCLFHLVEEFQQHGVKTVYVCEIAGPNMRLRLFLCLLLNVVVSHKQASQRVHDV